MTSYILLSLPLRTFDTGDKDEALRSVGSTIGSDNGLVSPFNVPAFKIGTLDALVQQADELAKLHSNCEGVVQKVAESLKTIVDDESKVEQNKMVNDSEATPTGEKPGMGTWKNNAADALYRANGSILAVI